MQLILEAIVFKTEAANHVSKQHAAEAQAKATHDEMLRVYSLKEEDT